ncbi:MAG: nicotinate-nucleotide--dimethylbenzimidazole phosphoribosyltransferase [Lachnospiraceae bacterium]|nr:nicotinate-nucleotide--dimethylbenzimidazole phosphoribosyltransferase [Lachnospiraceae bacterium]
MECLKRPTGSVGTLEWLNSLKAEAPDEAIRQQILQNWDKVAKPIDGLGEFEKLIARMGAVLGSSQLQLSPKAVLILCADNGIVEEGVSQSGQEVTLAVARAMGRQESAVGRMAKAVGADIILVDMGINYSGPIPGVMSKKVRCSTRNFHKEPAMTLEETLQAIRTGVSLVEEAKNKGYQILATGELGIGNTTTSTAVAAALLQLPVKEVCGRGAGLSDEGLGRKEKIIEEAIQKYGLYKAKPLEVLMTVGGLDIAGLTGVCMGGALHHVPILLDGVISMTAALLAERLLPGTKDYLFPSHKGKEPAMEKIAKALGLEPVIDAKMALGEGTGAVMMLSLLEIALSVYEDSVTFSHMQLEPYHRYESL